VHFSIRHGEKADSTIILTALAVDLAGNKEVLALRACAEESKDGWACLLQDLRSRGATQIDLIVTDGHDGLLAAVRSCLPSRLVSAVWCIMRVQETSCAMDSNVSRPKECARSCEKRSHKKREEDTVALPHPLLSFPLRFTS
jgi:hypothetical protein